MTYRTGNHWGVTIVRERKHGGQCAGGLCFESDFTDECDCWCHDGQPAAQLVAVVVNGDQALAERICALLNADERPGPLRTGDVLTPEALDTARAAFLAQVGKPPTVLPHTPDVDHARGAAEALALVRHELDRAAKPDEQLFAATIQQMLRVAAAELGLDEDAPPAALSSPVSAQQPPAGGSGAPEGPEALSRRFEVEDITTVHPVHGEGTRTYRVSGWETCRTTDPVTDDNVDCHGTGRACPRHGEVI